MAASSATSINTTASTTSQAVESAVSAAMDLVRDFSERDPRDASPENPWKNPQAMLEQLDQARAKIVAAWGTNDNNNNNNNNDDDDDDDDDDGTGAHDNDSDENNNNNKMRAAYMDMVTNAFADVLEDMRNNNGSNSEEELDVDILVDCLQSGMDFMSGEERDMFLMDMEDEEEGMEDDGDKDKLTPHEERRQQLGLQAC